MIPEDLHIIVYDSEENRIFSAKFEEGEFIPEKGIRFGDKPKTERLFGRIPPIGIL